MAGKEKCRPLSASEVKTLVRARDGYCCTECGMTNAEHWTRFRYALDVHRVVPGSEYTLKGCVTLCRPCHRTKPRSKPRTYHKGGKILLFVSTELLIAINVEALKAGMKTKDFIVSVLSRAAKKELKAALKRASRKSIR